MFQNVFKSSLKSRIIVTFTLITVILVFFVAIVSYYFIRNLYLGQVSEQVRVITSLTAKQIQPKYLQLLDLGTPVPLIRHYFHDLFKKGADLVEQTEWLIFDENFNTVIHSDTTQILGIQKPQLILYRNEILKLGVDQVTSSLPFKGDDGAWYLWGFYRINKKYWLARQESADRLKRVENFAWFFFYTGIAGMFLTILVGYLLARAMTRPIDRLVKFSSQLGKGNFEYSIPEGMVGEIGILSVAMDKMRSDLLRNRKEREDMLAQIAHEIRNPLGGIELLANLTKEDMNKGEHNTEYLDKILNEVSALKLLITSYLNYSRPQPAQPEWVHLDHIKNEINQIVLNRLQEKSISFSFENTITKIWFDPGQLKQIFLNLLNNSFDAVEQGGMVSVRTHKNKNNWEIIISDNGLGIKPDNLPNVFEPFFTTKREGTGLGLAISKKLCQENHAQLSVKNNSSAGCTFFITKEIIHAS